MSTNVPEPATKVGPTRNSPLDGHKPTDFDRRWPNGTISINPAALTLHGLSDDQVKVWRAAVVRLQELARRYIRYLEWRRVSQSRVAREWGVSSNRLSAFRTGKGWPSGPLVAILENQLPSLQHMIHLTPEGDWHDDKKQAAWEAEIAEAEASRRRAEALARLIADA